MGRQFKQVLFITGCGAALLTAVVVWRYVLTLTNVLAVLTSLCLGIFAFLCSNLYYRLPDDVSYTLPVTLNLYISKIIVFVIGHWFYNKLNNDSRDMRKSQERCLMNIIQENKDTAYGKEKHFESIDSRQDYVKTEKLTTYLDMKPYIDRVAKGEEGILTISPVCQLATTSGTTGTSNMLPRIKKQAQMFFKCLAITQYVAHHCIPTSREVRLTLLFAYSSRWGETEGGILIGPATVSRKKQLPKLYTTPEEACVIDSEPELCYIHWLFALRHRSLGTISAHFASAIYSAMTYLQNHWKDLVCDIECGQINTSLAIEESLKNKLNSLLEPNPSRAAELKRIFEDGFDGVVMRIWPHCQVVTCVDSGSMSLYGDLLKESYCRGMTFYSSIYAATEGLMAPNLWPLNHKREYILLPTVAFYEFIPEDQIEEEQPKTLFADEVEAGSTYELVLTTVNGLYRYRFGDVVHISRLHQECPVVEFAYRIGQLLNISSEKTPETAMFGAVTRMVSGWPNMQLTDYCCALSALTDQHKGNKISQHYVVFLELTGNEDNFRISQDQRDQMDKNLCDIYPLYANYRHRGSIAPMVVHVLQRGTFGLFRQHKLETTSVTANQFKVPRTLTSKVDVMFMMNHIHV